MRQVLKSLKDKVYSMPEYDFLDKQGELCFLSFAGSYSYGTNVETSDIDIRGVLMETPNSLLGLEKFEQFEHKETDTVLYGFNKFIGLLMKSNPSSLELLGIPEEDYISLSSSGKLLIDNKDLFLSQNCVNSFAGYSLSQLRRLKNALAVDISQEEKEDHIYQTINNSVEHLNEHYRSFAQEDLSIFVDSSEKEEFNSEIFVNLNLKKYPLRDFVGIMSEMNSIIKSYNKLNGRNSKKDDLHINKHSMHILRLLYMGIDLLEKQEIITYRKEEHDLLMAVRNGKYMTDDGKYHSSFFDLVDELNKRFEYAKENTSLPKKPDFDKIQELMVEINKKVLK